MPISTEYRPAPRWTKLGPHFYDPVKPALFPQAVLRFRNDRWDKKVGLHSLTAEEWKTHFWNFAPLPHNLPDPLALRYHGHQFLNYNPHLGDGRGFLLAQLRDDQQRLLDLGTKGSGTTPWSRRGDGRLTLKGAVREVLATEMLEALGVNTSKTFSVFETGEHLQRNDEPSPTRSAVLVRLSHGHVRIGTFQRQAYLKDTEALRQLVFFCCENYYPQLDRQQDFTKLTQDFFVAVAQSLAQTTAQWMIHGFVHGVLNTDNINISGESFDYGPYRFLPHYDSRFTAAYFDHSGLYAYGEQPRIMLWNLQQLQSCLQLVMSPDSNLSRGLESYQNLFSQEVVRLFFKKMNLKPSQNSDRDTAFFAAVIQFLELSKIPYDSFFFDWNGGKLSEHRASKSPRHLFYSSSAFSDIKSMIKSYVAEEESLLQSPYYSQEDSTFLLIDDIERIWSAIETNDDWQPFQQKIDSLRARP